MPTAPQSIPTVIISNDSEGTIDYLQKAGPQQDDLVYRRELHGDRTCFWKQDHKLVLTSRPIPHLAYLHHTVGYTSIQHLSPQKPSLFLSLDILREPQLIQGIVEFAGANRTITLIPYANTRQFFQLVATLQAQYGLTVLLPESPQPEQLWLRNYINTKSGFRTLVSQWLREPSLPPCPPGMIAPSLETAAEMAHWFVQNNQACIVKIDDGADGKGQERFDRHLQQNLNFSPSTILKTLRNNPFFQTNSSAATPIIVEQWIQTDLIKSPSIELFIPPLGQGEPQITYVGNQLFLEFGRCAGILIAKELLAEPWYPAFAQAGLAIAHNLQKMGYVGHFDVDAVVDEQDNLFLLEGNPRRTSTTSIHEFAQFHFGADYLDQLVLLSDDEMDSGGINNFEQLQTVMGDLLYLPQQNPHHPPKGVVVTIASLLEHHQFGCLTIAPSTQDALSLHHQLQERLK
ncbi:MAG: hypothetical protein F6J87_05280 [Spirulina sp. SIO3F2]|nr:hypothetical protein [Spirulina sp. SIO3F2]